MQKLLVGLLIVVLGPLCHAGLPAYDAKGDALPTLAPMLKQINPAVVNIATFSTRKQAQNPLLNDPFFRHFFGDRQRQAPQDSRPQKRQQSAGSGVIVDAAQGIVITNYHVIKDADEVQVSLQDGRVYQAEVKGSDPDLDIAVLKIDAEDLVHVDLADSDALEVGDFVVAIGNPFGLGQTVTTGIVSALGRTGLGIEGYENFIQTDASINPGNSGGALVNLRGELIGINTAIISPAGGNVGIGFAIPINMAEASMKQILEHGEVKRGQIGVGIQDISAELRQAFELENGQQGVLITAVFEDTPAEKAGLKPGDIIVAIDGSDTSSAAQLRSQIGVKKIGEKVDVSIIRDGKTKKLRVAIGDPVDRKDDPSEIHPLLEGASFENADDGKGVIVAQVQAGSAVAYHGVRSGDIILSVNRKRVASIEQMSKLIDKDSEQILLLIGRNNQQFYTLLQ